MAATRTTTRRQSSGNKAKSSNIGAGMSKQGGLQQNGGQQISAAHRRAWGSMQKAYQQLEPLFAGQQQGGQTALKRSSTSRSRSTSTS